LASVILRMMAFKLGEIRSFPFIEPPAESAIVGGYRLLSELGAVTADNESPNSDDYCLTKLGRRLSRLPVDPTVARMLLQAQEENVSEEVLVIASGLSIQDPRERPAETAKEADEMHKQFIHPESDFLTILNIWNSYHEKLDALSQNKLRKFCKSHYLSYQRMREWRDIHHQLERILHERPSSKPVKRAKANKTKTTGLDVGSLKFESIHKSILSGLLSNIACKEEEHNYRGPRNRKALLFPGSGLFDHEAARKQRKASYAKKNKPKPAKTSAPAWIVCGEWMETSRLYARNAAKIEPEWIEAMAGDLLSIRHSEPFWSTKLAAVLCKERRLLFGLEIRRSNVSYRRVDPEKATEIFIRNGLIEGGIKERPEFFTHNEAILETAASEAARQKLGSTLILEDRLFDFYHQRLSDVGSYPDIKRFAKSHHGGSLDFLKAELADLLPSLEPIAGDDFPKSIQIGGIEMPLTYRNEPGHEANGVTLSVEIQQLNVIQQNALDWAIPGHLDEMIETLLRNLPKPLRIKLHPLKERRQELRQKVQPSEQSLSEQLEALLMRDYGIQTYRDQWQCEMPEHLKLRIEVRNAQNEILAVGRDLDTLRDQLDKKSTSIQSDEGMNSVPAWQRATEKFERENISQWDFGDLPEHIDLSRESGLPLVAYPALALDSGQVHLRLRPTKEAAIRSTEEAWLDLCETVTGRSMAWIQRDIRELKKLGTALLPLGGYEAVKESAWQHLRRHLYGCENKLPLQESTFNQTLARAAQEKEGIIQRLVERLEALLLAREEVALLLERKKTKQAISYPGMLAQLERLAPADLLDQFDFTDLPKMTRFLRGMLIRAQRAKDSIQRDIDKAQRVAPFEDKFKRLMNVAAQRNRPRAARPYMILLEEFKISVFAQELGTGQKTSEKRLDKLFAELSEQMKHEAVFADPAK
ncbi:MAG: DUF3418 domain-containing protein, partial [Opitutales bacterium]